MRLRTSAAVLICAAVGLAAEGGAAADKDSSDSSVVESLVGLSNGAATERFGEPALAAKEPPAEMWRYSLEDCTLYLFLYALDGEAVSRVTHAELTMRDGASVAPRACLAGRARAPARRKHRSSAARGSSGD